MNSITHLGIMAGDGRALLSTVGFDGRNERSEASSWKEARKCLDRWRAVRPGDELEIVPLQRRSYDGWEAAGR